jgi:hypothetical protein
VYDGKPFHMFVIGEHGTALQLGMRERAGLRALRTTKLGSRVFIEPQGKKDLGGDRAMWEFTILAEEVATSAGGTRPAAAWPMAPSPPSGSGAPPSSSRSPGYSRHIANDRRTYLSSYTSPTMGSSSTSTTTT